MPLLCKFTKFLFLHLKQMCSRVNFQMKVYFKVISKFKIISKAIVLKYMKYFCLSKSHFLWAMFPSVYFIRGADLHP